MSDEKMREEFESAYMRDVSVRFRGAEVSDDEWVARASNGEYRSYRAAGAWWAWQASRAALVIDLPKNPNEEFADRAAAIAACREAIEASGIKVQP